MYIIHGTQPNTFEKIFKDGFIKPHQIDTDKPTKMIFTHLFYKNIPHQKTQTPFWGSVGIILSKDILKDIKFRGYISMGSGSHEWFSDKNAIIKGNGKLKRMPVLKKYVNCINNGVKERYQFLHLHAFIHSHEILFYNKISIKKYCKALILYEKDQKFVKKAKKLAEKYNINIIYRKYPPIKKGYSQISTGINYLIDEIDKIDEK